MSLISNPEKTSPAHARTREGDNIPGQPPALPQAPPSLRPDPQGDLFPVARTCGGCAILNHDGASGHCTLAGDRGVDQVACDSWHSAGAVNAWLAQLLSRQPDPNTEDHPRDA